MLLPTLRFAPCSGNPSRHTSQRQTCTHARTHACVNSAARAQPESRHHHARSHGSVEHRLQFLLHRRQHVRQRRRTIDVALHGHEIGHSHSSHTTVTARSSNLLDRRQLRAKVGQRGTLGRPHKRRKLELRRAAISPHVHSYTHTHTHTCDGTHFGDAHATARIIDDLHRIESVLLGGHRDETSALTTGNSMISCT
jgi:hypothetical protein